MSPTSHDDQPTRPSTTPPDPLQWLEDLGSEQTQAWVARQNSRSAASLDRLSARGWFEDVIDGSLSSPRIGIPERQGNHYVCLTNDGCQPQDSVIETTDVRLLSEATTPLIDPVTIDPTGLTAISGIVPWRNRVTGISISPDGRLVAYGLITSGSDWIEWRVRDRHTGEDLPDRIGRSKWCLPEWVADSSAFVYAEYPPDGLARGSAIRLHRIGRPQDEDELLVEAEEFVRAASEVSHERDWLLVDTRLGMAEANTITAHRLSPEGRLGPAVPVVTERRELCVPVSIEHDRLLLRRDGAKGLGEVVRLDLADLEAGADPEQALTVVIPSGEGTISQVARGGDEILVVRQVPHGHAVERFSLDGEPVGPIDIGDLCTVSGVSASPGDSEVFIGVTSYLRPSWPLRVDLSTGTAEELPGRPVAPPSSVSRHTTSSRDGTTVPYTLVRGSSPAPGATPTLVYGYGGFGYPALPSYSPVWPAWVEAGGVLAFTTLRGGNEFGRAWHEAGRLEHKQSVFDDYIAVIEHLHHTGVTTPDQTVAFGRSNGGLLIGAALTQRPELLTAAVPTVGVLDMLRFHKLSVGWTWIPEYGDPDNPEHRAFLEAYSPVHQVRHGVTYPPTLVLTADHDDRVWPSHSYKFAHRLQEAGAPALLRVETSTGHGGGKPRHLVIKETADILTFAAHHAGLRPR